MKRTMSCLRLVAGLAAFAALPFAALPTHGAPANPSAWRFRVNKPEAVPQTVTVTRASQGWFMATDARGKEVPVVFPKRHGWVQRNGQLIPTEALRAGDRVEVWGLVRGNSIQTDRARLVTEPQGQVGAVRPDGAGCCTAGAACCG